MPKVSIIMGAYNCADTITTAIHSMQEQTLTDWEMIICDDCSTDNTYEVINNMALEDKRIVLIKNKKNSKLALSLNHCLQYARSQYIARMDSDDICYPDRLKIQANFLDKHPEYDVVGGGVILYDENGDKNILLNPEKPSVEYMYRHVPFFHPTIMMRKSIYDSLGGYTVAHRTQRGQDLDLWFRFFAKGFNGYNLQRPVLKYHDSLGDTKKKNKMSVSWGLTKTMLFGFKLNHFPLHKYVWVLKPVVTSLLPQFIIYKLHNSANK